MAEMTKELTTVKGVPVVDVATTPLEVVVDGRDAQVQLGEGALWDTRAQLFYWIDIIGQRVFVYDPATKENRAIMLEYRPGCVVATSHPDVLLLAMQNGFNLVNWRTGAIVPTGVDPESHLPLNRFNDGKCDPQGRLWAGTMNNDATTRECGALYCLSADWTTSKHTERTSISNGIVWNRAGTKMWHIDSPIGHLDEYDFDGATGTIKHVRTLVRFEPSAVGNPDGMTIDDEDQLWVACWGGYHVLRIDSKTAKVLLVLPVPSRWVTSVAFGGRDLNDLYITSSSCDGDEQCDRVAHPLSGSVFVARGLPFRGVSGVPFAGDLARFPGVTSAASS